MPAHAVKEEAECAFLHFQHLHLLQYIQQAEDTHDIENKNDDLNTPTEASIFRAAVVYHCLLHEIENNIICMTQCCRENRSPHI